MRSKFRAVAYVNLAVSSLFIVGVLKLDSPGDNPPPTHRIQRVFAPRPKPTRVASHRGLRSFLPVDNAVQPGSSSSPRASLIDSDDTEDTSEEASIEPDPETSARVSGQLFDSAGYSIEGVVVLLRFREAATFEDHTLASATSDREGRFVFDDIEENGPLWIEFKSPDYRELHTNLFYARNDRATLKLRPVVLESLGVLMGLVIDQWGYPVPGVSVHVFDETHNFRHTRMPRTDREGRFVVSGLPTGTFGIRVRQGMRNIGSLRGVPVIEGLVEAGVVVNVEVEGQKDRPKDSQTLAVYRSERMIMDEPRRLPTLRKAVRWTRNVVSSTWFRENFPHVLSIEVKEGHGRDPAYARPYPRGVQETGAHGYISLPRWALERSVVLHEIAHVCSPHGHDPLYAGVLLALVEKFIGAEKASKLLRAYERNGVEFVPFEPVFLRR